MLKAIIFDMDGVLIDSEPFWKISEVKHFNAVGVPLSEEMCETTVGKRIQEVTRYWHNKYPWGLSIKPFEQLEEEIIGGVIRLINEKGIPAEGVYDILDFFRSKDLPVAIASSSALSIINAVIDKFNIRQYFKVTHSAESEQHGKPHPAIYLNTAKSLGIEPQYCLAIEDSYNGMKAAIDAGMKTVVIPEKKFYSDSKFDIADMKLHSLKDFIEENFIILNLL